MLSFQIQKKLFEIVKLNLLTRMTQYTVGSGSGMIQILEYSEHSLKETVSDQTLMKNGMNPETMVHLIIVTCSRCT